MPSVLQDWVLGLTLAQQGTLLTAVRGPDGVRKDHPVKQLLRAYRRCVMNGAKPVPNDFMLERPTLNPMEVELLTGLRGKGLPRAGYDVAVGLRRFFERGVDELPHHQLMHLVHSAEVVGYLHPDADVRDFWLRVYAAAVLSFHMKPESSQEMVQRLAQKGERAYY